MSKKKALFDISRVNDDIVLRALSFMAQLLYIKICALANEEGGFVQLRGKVLTLEEAADICGVRVSGAELSAAISEILSMQSLLEERDGVWCVPDMVKAAELSEKRARAGSKGGKKSAAKTRKVTPKQGVEHSSDICSSKPSSKVISIEETKAYKKTKGYKSTKEKRTKKENNNKYIYIYSEKVFIGDQGSEENPIWSPNRNFTLFKREIEALLRGLPYLSEDQLFTLLAQHDDWLDRPENCDAPWLACLLGFLKKINQAEADRFTAQG